MAKCTAPVRGHTGGGAASWTSTISRDIAAAAAVNQVAANTALVAAQTPVQTQVTLDPIRVDVVYQDHGP